MHRIVLLTALLAVLATACGDDPETASPVASQATTTSADSSGDNSPTTTTVAARATTTTDAPSAEGCAHVIDGDVVASGDSFTVSATVRSADTGIDKYADGWEVRTVAGDVLGERILAHPHVNEQPFTRSVDVAIPADVDSVVLAAHDSVVGFCGDTYTVSIER